MLRRWSRRSSGPPPTSRMRWPCGPANARSPGASTRRLCARRPRRLATLGIGHGSTVAFMAANRPEFNIADAAVMHLGATCFSVYNTAAPEQVAHVLGDADH